MKITYITAKAFGQWVKKVTPENMLEMLDFDPDDPESVQRWLEETCPDESYQECQDIFVNEYLHGFRKKTDKEIETEILRYVEGIFRDTFGTTSVSEAFKQLVKEYKDVIMSINTDPRSIDEIPVFSIFFDYITAKYKYIEYSVEDTNTITRFTTLIQEYDPITDIRDLWTQISQVFYIHPAKSINELSFTPGYLALFIPKAKEIYFLLGYTEDPVSKLPGIIRGVIITHSGDQPIIVIIPKFTPHGRIKGGVGAILY